jgi:energy-coupling factor transport system permease protein
MNTAGSLRLQTWLIWGVAASMPFMLGRNPFPMAIAALAIAAVCVTWRAVGIHHTGWKPLLKLIGLFSAISVLFNVLTVRTGNLVIVTIPDSAPLLDGELTWNAVIYGLLAAFGIFGIVATWATVGMAARWSSLVRLLPDAFIGLAAAGSSAINLVPETLAGLADIREAAAARGFAPRGVRSAGTILTPMINVGLDRSMRLAEVLEARGFGSRAPGHGVTSTLRNPAWIAVLTGSFMTGYGLIAGITWSAVVGAASLVIAIAVLSALTSGPQVRRTRYRHEVMSIADWAVIGVSSAVIVFSAIARQVDPAAFVYEPYPTLTYPASNLWLLATLFGLVLPAVFAPAPGLAND